jgi:two-component system response regulator YesN
MEVLKKVGEELEADIQQEEYLDMASDQIAQNLSLLREQLLSNILDKKLEEKDVLKQLHFLQLPEAEPRQLGVIQIPEFFANRPLLKEEDKELLMFGLENIIFEAMEPYHKLFLRDQSGFMVMLLWEAIPEDSIDEIRKKVRACFKVSISLCFEKVIGGIASIPEVYLSCKQKIEEHTSISPVIRRAREYVQDHFSESDLTLEKVAESLHVSSVYLSRMFKQELGRSFVSILTNLRMKKAVTLLNTTDLSILEIAEKAGYDTQHYFSTAFKKAMGVSPKQYRKNVK